MTLRPYSHKNPLLESLIGGFGGGLGAAAAFYGTKSIFDKRSKKRNPMSSTVSRYASRYTSSFARNPISQTKMTFDEVLAHLRASGYEFDSNYSDINAAIGAAKRIEKEDKRYKAKVVTVASLPFSRASGSSYPIWVLKQRKGFFGENPYGRIIYKYIGGNR